MNKKILIALTVVVSLLLVSSGLFAYYNSQNNKEATNTAIELDNVSSDDKQKLDISEQTTNIASYITYDDYINNPEAYKDRKKVFFFHASWCSVCQAIDKEINADISKIPEGVIIIKTDFDDSKDLRKKYGVTTQYTFVQVDKDDNELAQWTASSFDSAINGIKS